MYSRISNSEELAFRAVGTSALLRYRRLGPVTYALPVTVVQDDDTLIGLYAAVGTPMKKRTLPDGQPIPRALSYDDRAKLPIVVGDGVWRANNVLILVRPGAAHDVRLFWESETWRFLGWYINLQAPLRRVEVGFDTADHVLDIDVAPDLAWRWKDEDEFAIAQRIGRFSEDEAAAIHAEGERIIADVEALRWPFDGGYETWRPDPSWGVPVMPVDWNRD